jgi:hypothetical protein
MGGRFADLAMLVSLSFMAQETIQKDGYQYNDNSGLKSFGNVDCIERTHDRNAEARGADKRSNNHHRQGQHDGLGKARHDLGQRVGKFHFRQQLPFRCAKGLASFYQ